MDWFAVLSLMAGVVLLTGYTVAISHILRRTAWLPSWLAWYWFRKSEDSRRQGWTLLVGFTGLLLVTATSWWPTGPTRAMAVAGLVLAFVGVVIYFWPQGRRKDPPRPWPSDQPPPVQ